MLKLCFQGWRYSWTKSISTHAPETDPGRALAACEGPLVAPDRWSSCLRTLQTSPCTPIFRARVVFACPIFLQNLSISCSSDKVVDDPSPCCSPVPCYNTVAFQVAPYRSATCRHILELSGKFSKFSERRWEVTHGAGPTREKLALESAVPCLLLRARVEML